MKKSEKCPEMNKTNEYTVKRIDDDLFELWFDDERLATMTKEEAWPVMMGQVHPDTVIDQQIEETETDPGKSKDR
jgi:hypothetical protein